MTFITDLDDLIRHHHGDVKKLREIRDTIRHDNFITTVDKNYVESLITTHLVNQPLDKSLSHRQPSTKIKSQPKYTTDSRDAKSISSPTFSSNKKIGVLASVVAAIAIIVIVGFTAVNQTDMMVPTISSTATNSLLVKTDQSTYQNADIISISGDAISDVKSIELSIKNTNGLKIWNEIINPKKAGKFSTLIIAGGGGWENNGVYTLKVEQDDFTKEIEFKFVA